MMKETLNKQKALYRIKNLFFFCFMWLLLRLGWGLQSNISNKQYLEP